MAQQGSSRPFRPIAPRTLPDPLPPPPAPPGGGVEEVKIRRASAACTECKRRRTKCSADTTGPPCTECALHRRDCVIDEFADKRRKVAARRAQEELRYYRGFVEQLLKAIRQGEGTDVEAIVAVIRSGASHDEIRAVVRGFLKRDAKGEDDMPDGLGQGTETDDTSKDLTPESWS
ncbi:hypothetical protein BDV24DRAFT_160308 [Aspergillus arachidicola]|uniref:C6 transcription factor n=1 Tax=Aspergillus arachidicola TaxID=656916 RepID=A0A2G7EPU5_9EURO|nr:hypothetical protein BDV24DRAFT_160308 [Aspergillus arachidicola]PIG69481.1 C6 transcription factor [Aspergillus arachidicola]